ASSQTCWYVVQTHPHAEQKASSHLVRQGFAVYLPQFLKRRRHARQVRTVACPLFPRYLFVAIDVDAQQWRCIKSTIGVANLVCSGEQPAVIAGTIVADLRRREDANGFIQLARRSLSVGDKIRVVGGVFESCFGLFEEMSDAERVTILLDLLGRR